MERYEELKMEIIAFANEDVITTSDPDGIETGPVRGIVPNIVE